MDIITANRDVMSHKSVKFEGQSVRVNKTVAVLAISVSGLISVDVLAGDWKVQPSLKVGSTYSDNIDLEPDGDSDLVTEVSPAIHVGREGRRLSVNLDYSLQNLMYADDSDRDKSNHRLSANANAEVFADTLFVDFSSSYSQQLVDRRSSGSSDAISGSANLNDVFAYSVSPYWQQRVGDVANYKLRYTYDMVNSSGSSGGSDSEGNAVSFNIANGPATGRINWNVNYGNQQTDYDDDDKSDTESASARVGYQLTRSLNSFVSGTYENHEFVGDRGNSEPDDSSVGAGATWTPSQDFSLTLAYNERLDPGPDEDGTFISSDLFWAPTARTNLSLGLDNRFFGETYRGNLSHHTRWTRWNFSYQEGASNFRNEILEQGFVVCPQTATTIAQCRVLVPGESLLPGEAFLREGDDFYTGLTTSITEDTFISKTGRASVSIVGARNTVSLATTDTRREFVADNAKEKDLLVDLSWSYQLAPRTDSLVSIGHTQQQFDDSSEDDFMRYLWRITHQIGGSSIFYVEAQFNERDSAVISRNYEENRLTASFKKFF